MSRSTITWRAGSGARAVTAGAVGAVLCALLAGCAQPGASAGSPDRTSSRIVSSEPVTSEPVTPEPVTPEPVTSEPVTSGASTSEAQGPATSGDGGEPVAPSSLPSPVAPRREAAVLGSYDGTATVTLTSYDYCGNGFDRHQAGVQRYSVPAQLILDRPLAGGTGEPNPLHLMFAAGNQAGAGAVSLASALEVSGVVLTYWSLDWSNGRLQGRLAADHAAEAAAYNLFNESRLLIPCRPSMGELPPQPTALSPGATLAGSVSAGHARFRLIGQTSDAMSELDLSFTS